MSRSSLTCILLASSPLRPLVLPLLLICFPHGWGCNTLHAFPFLEGRDDVFELSEVDGFDAAEFRDRLARLPADAGWDDPVRRNEYVIESLNAAGWPGRAKELNYDATELHRQIAQALYDAANRPEWRHERYQESTVGPLTEDLSRLCGVEKHTWIELIAPLLDVPRKSREYRTVTGIVRASRLAEPGSSYRGLSLFVRSNPGGGKRDLFLPEHDQLLHEFYIEAPIGITLELYSLYPAEGRNHPERWDLLWELSSLFRHRAIKTTQRFHEDGPEAADALTRSPYPPRAVEILAALGENGGRPGEALAYFYYSGRGAGAPFEYEPRLREALIASGSEYAHRRLRKLAGGIRKGVPDPEAKIAEIRDRPEISHEAAEEMVEAVKAEIREADAIDAALGRG